MPRAVLDANVYVSAIIQPAGTPGPLIERKGKPLAALVPIERLEQMRRFARRHALDLLEQQKQSTVSEEQALQVALEAQRSARKRSRKPRRRIR